MSRTKIVLIVVAGVIGAVAVGLISVLELVTGPGKVPIPANSALINLDGVAAAADGGKTVDVTLGKDTPQKFQGTTGCDSRHFVAYFGGDPKAAMIVTYSASQATMAYSSEVYRFDEGPQKQSSGALLWQGDFGPSGTFSHIIVQVNCPAP